MDTMFVVAALIGPSAFMGGLWVLDRFDGQKTNISGAGVLAASGLAMADYTAFLPPGVPQALVVGFGIATLLSNTVLSYRT